MRYYGIDPTTTPYWLLSILERSLPLLMSDEMYRAAAIMRGAFGAGRNEWRAFMAGLRSNAKPKTERAPDPVLVSAENAWWFEQNGIPYRVIDPEN